MDRAAEQVTIKLRDGKEYTLSFPMRTLKAIKKEYNVSLMKGQGFDSIDEDKLPELVHRGLVENHPELTLDYVESNLHGADTIYALRQLVHAATGQDMTPKNGVSAESPAAPSPSSISGQPQDTTSDVPTQSSGI